VLNDCVTWDFIPSAPKVKLLPTPETAFDYLPSDEAARFLSYTQEHRPNDFPLYSAAIYTGARMGELFGLRWTDVDLSRKQITVQRSYSQPYTKSKKVRRVPINKQLLITLKAWKATGPGGEYVFPAAKGGMRRKEVAPSSFRKDLEAAGCHAIKFHDLRHTAASLMVMAGISLRTVQQILGHSTILVTEKYAHLAPDFMAGEADRLSLDVQAGLGTLKAM